MCRAALFSALLVTAWSLTKGMDCPSIPIPLAEAVVEAHGCMTKMGRPVKNEEYDKVQSFLMQCAERQQPGSSNPLVFLMMACSDAKYLDGTADCMFGQEEAIFKELNLAPADKQGGDLVFKCLKDFHEDLVKKRRKP
ncbi:uncharacterized protein [Dermacentor andersoni]|uniref:uncharacterized protein n=1 Tax=Dermacentor andersoni TaxID=34620 RepID=UPI002155EE4B|nr:uncharacterized protein LOC126537044 [Dermacentor andersoni]